MAADPFCCLLLGPTATARAGWTGRWRDYRRALGPQGLYGWSTFLRALAISGAASVASVGEATVSEIDVIRHGREPRVRRRRLAVRRAGCDLSQRRTVMAADGQSAAGSCHAPGCGSRCPPGHGGRTPPRVRSSIGGFLHTGHSRGVQRPATTRRCGRCGAGGVYPCLPPFWAPSRPRPLSFVGRSRDVAARNRPATIGQAESAPGAGGSPGNDHSAVRRSRHGALGSD